MVNKYYASVEVVIYVEFEDDGVNDIWDQAHDAVWMTIDPDNVLHSQVVEVVKKND